MAPTLETLPTEIVQSILLYLPPEDTVNLNLTSQKLRTLTDEPLIWRHLCRTTFTHWNATHDIAARFAGPIEDVDWKALFRARRLVNRMVREELDSILSTQQNRIQKIQRIAQVGYDAKEELLRQRNCSDDAEDVLARRYYADTVLGCIHRAMAVGEWDKLRRCESVSLERSFASFDLFVEGDKTDFGTIKEAIDDLARQHRIDFPDFSNLTTREKALSLISWIRMKGFQGAEDDHYYDLRNSFVGIALESDDHQSLPIVLVVIYSLLAQRLGFNAKPSGFPWHIYGIVYAPDDYDLDGRPRRADARNTKMFIDPFRDEKEVHESDLTTMLRTMGASDPEHWPHFLNEASVSQMVFRTSRNILNAVQGVRDGQGLALDTWMNHYPDTDDAFYGALWAMALFGANDSAPSSGTVLRQQHQYFSFLSDFIRSHFPWDAQLLRNYVMAHFGARLENELRTLVRGIEIEDSMAKPIIRRNLPRYKGVKFYVGLMFQHKRYGYEGVIAGWDPKCDAGEDWIRQMNVDRLSNGREQSFYHVL